tara:strand:- start:61 stop:975 length:915 start_codon:yes stop_codon:yes gene_type:complete
MKIEQQYCSPSAKDNGPTCLSKESLKTLIDIYNKSKNNKKEQIKYYDNFKQLELFKKLDNKMKNLTKGSGKYWLWPDIIYKLSPDNKYNLKLIKKKNFIPEMPKSWHKNKKEWLSNYDIDNVMLQYNNTKKYNYKYIGTFSIDFALKDNFGNCLHSDFCNINIKDTYINKNIKYIGFITNLDKHDEPGSHWTSTFIIIDPNSKSFGAYYYDSVSRKIPKMLNDFLLNIKSQCKIIYPNKNFVIKYNNKQHQYQNTECGMFSIIYQLRWLNLLLDNKDVQFGKIINNKYLNDNNVNNMRMEIFIK